MTAAEEEGRKGGLVQEENEVPQGVEDSDLMSELRALEEYRSDYQARHALARLDKHDPDVERMIEALAFFTLRTRSMASRNVKSTFERLFRRYFDFLLAPLASMVMLRAACTQQRAEVALLPRGSELRLTAPDGAMATFRTLHDVRILPLWLERTRLLLRGGGGYRLLLEFRAAAARTMQVGTLRLHVRYLDDYETSLRVLYNIRKHLERTLVVYDQSAQDDTDGDPCEISYGPVVDPNAPGDDTHPLEAVRRFFHFPEQDLFLNIQVPPSRRAWSRFTICLDLGPKWPVKPTLGSDVFQLFAVPAVNLRRETSEPIVCDGTQDAYPIRYPGPGREFVLRSVKGVYELTQRGLKALQSGVLPGAPEGESWEVDERGGPGKSPVLLVRMPDAVAVPRKLVVDALWHQPWFTQSAVGALKVGLLSRHLEAVVFDVLGGVRPEHESPLHNDPSGILQLLALRMEPVLGLPDLKGLLGYLGTVSGGPYRDLPGLLLAITSQQIPDSAIRGTGIQHVYNIKTKDYPDELEPMVWTLLCQIYRLLDAWNHDAAVTLNVDTSGSPLTQAIG